MNVIFFLLVSSLCIYLALFFESKCRIRVKISDKKEIWINRSKGKKIQHDTMTIFFGLLAVILSGIGCIFGTTSILVLFGAL